MHSSLMDTEQMALPVEVEIFQPMAYYQDPPKEAQVREIKISHTKTKKRFWQSLFGKKKCNNCSKNKSDCGCKHFKMQNCKKTEGKIHIQDGCEKNMVDSKEKQNNDNCQAKCNYPLISQSGVGCHLYFCIDSKRKKPQTKSKKVIIRGSNKAKDVTQHHLPNSDTTGPKVTIVCEDSSTNFMKGSPSKTVQEPFNLPSPAHFKSNTHPGVNMSQDEKITSQPTPFSESLHKIVKNKYNPHIETTVLQLNMPNIGLDQLEREQTDCNYNGQENKLKNNTNDMLNKICNSYSSINTNCTNNYNPCNKSIGKEDTREKVKEIQDNIQQYLGGNRKQFSILRTSANFRESYNNENIVLPMKADSFVIPDMGDLSSHKHNKKKISFKGGKYLGPNHGDDISSDFGSYNPDKRKRSSVASKGAFARNSIISLRRERRHSQLEGRVSLILQKLDNIEGKIAELEKVSCEKPNNITMGISCNKKKSTVSIKFNTENEKSKDNMTVQPTPFSKSVHKIVNIKSQGDNIFVTTPNEVNVVKKKQKSHVDPKDVAYYNAYEMDVHTIASRCHSKPIKCKNPKIIIENLSRNSQAGNYKWRRVSEELKISQMDTRK